MINKKNLYSTTIVLAVLAIIATATPAFADTTTTTNQPNKGFLGGIMHNGGNKAGLRPVVFGTVSAINGNSITVSGKQGFGTNANKTTTTYTVDATNAKIMKNNVAGTVSSIVVGDTIMVQGTVTGTNVVATTIRDGVMTRGNNPAGKANPQGQGNISNLITGNGQPVIAGTISAISGSTLTITNKSNVTYTVDTTNAKIVKGQNTIVVSNMAIGDTVVIQGTVNGNSIVASNVIDQTKLASDTTTGTTPKVNNGFFSGIGSFFKKIFGF